MDRYNHGFRNDLPHNMNPPPVVRFTNGLQSNRQNRPNDEEGVYDTAMPSERRHQRPNHIIRPNYLPNDDVYRPDPVHGNHGGYIEHNSHGRHASVVFEGESLFRS